MVASITCCRCGVEIRDPAERTLLHTACGPLRYRRPSTDLCRECSEAFLAFVEESPDAGGPPAKRPAPAPRPAPVHRPHTPALRPEPASYHRPHVLV